MGVILLLSLLLITSIATTVAIQAKYRTGEIQLNLDLDDKTVELDWQVTKVDDIYGFKVSVSDDDDKIIYTSPILHKTANSLTINEVVKSGKARVCVAVLHNETETLTDVCENVEVNDLQMVIGILAGVVFLIPCVVAMSYIVYKDMKVTKHAIQDPSEIEILIKPVTDITPSTSAETTTGAKHVNGKDNLAFDNELGETKPSIAKKACEVTVDSDITVDIEKCVSQNRTQTNEIDSAAVRNDTQENNTKDSANNAGDETEIYVIRM